MTLAYERVCAPRPSLPFTGLSHGIVGATCDKLLDVSLRTGARYLLP